MTTNEIEKILAEQMPHFDCVCYPDCKCPSNENDDVVCSEVNGAATSLHAYFTTTLADMTRRMEEKDRTIVRLEEENKQQKKLLNATQLKQPPSLDPL